MTDEAQRIAGDHREALLPRLRAWLDRDDDDAGMAAAIEHSLRMLEAFTGRSVEAHAEEWAGLPDSIQHGIIRLAAYTYREGRTADVPIPPAAVAALWRPWRRTILERQSQ